MLNLDRTIIESCEHHNLEALRSLLIACPYIQTLCDVTPEILQTDTQIEKETKELLRRKATEPHVFLYRDPLGMSEDAGQTVDPSALRDLGFFAYVSTLEEEDNYLVETAKLNDINRSGLCSIVLNYIPSPLQLKEEESLFLRVADLFAATQEWLGYFWYREGGKINISSIIRESGPHRTANSEEAGTTASIYSLLKVSWGG